MPKRKTKIVDFSGGEPNEPFGQSRKSVQISQQFRELSIGAKLLYCYCISQAASKKARQCLLNHGNEDGTNYVLERDFVFPATDLEQYGIDRGNACRWFSELEKKGFIIIRERNKNRRKPNVYSFSSKWREL